MGSAGLEVGAEGNERSRNKKPFHEGEWFKSRSRPLTLMVLPHKIPAFPTRSSFGTAYRERPDGLSHIEQTLKPGMLGQPVRITSLEASGQWPMCSAGASPTEDPSFYILISTLLKPCQEKFSRNFRNKQFSPKNRSKAKFQPARSRIRSAPSCKPGPHRRAPG